MSLSAYDQVLYEDHGTKCWDETLGLFEKTAANKSFKDTDFIVFLNKSDIFDEKIKYIPFTEYKSDFKDNANNGEHVKEWLRNQFIQRFYNPSQKAQQYNNNRKGGNGYHHYGNYHNNNNTINEEEEQKYNDNGQQMNGNNNNNDKRGLHFHVTCATDTSQIETVVRYVQIELIRKLMSRAALL